MKLGIRERYILRRTRKASPSEQPMLCGIFRDMRRRLRCGRRISLKIGEVHSAGLAMVRSPRTGTILVDRREISTMNEREMKYLLGHEFGHLLEYEGTGDGAESAENASGLPRALFNFLGWICGQIRADIAGVAECRSTFVAGSHLSDGDEEMRELYENPLGPLPEKYYGRFEVAVRVQALGLLAKSEYFYEVINMPLFGYGGGLMSFEEYHEEMGRLLDPYMGLTEEQCSSLGEFLGAALYIAGCKAGDVRWYRELENLGDYGEPVELLMFASADEAYERIKSVAGSIHGTRHPMKHIAMGVVEDAIYREDVDFDEREKLENLLTGMARIDSTAA